jgi:hypothetical protein
MKLVGESECANHELCHTMLHGLKVDEEAIKLVGESGLCLIVEPLNKRTGLASRYGTWLLERGLAPKYGSIGICKEGSGGLWEHAYHQGYDPKSVMAKVKSLLA